METQTIKLKTIRSTLSRVRGHRTRSMLLMLVLLATLVPFSVIDQSPIAHAATTDFVDLGTLGGDYSSATDVNDDEVVVGWASTTAHKKHAFRWTESEGMSDLGSFGGPSGESMATDINNAGVIVGTSTSSNGYQVFRWTKSEGMVSLGTFPGLAAPTEFVHINDAGTIVVGTTERTYDANGNPFGDPIYRVFRWTQSTGLKEVPGFNSGGSRLRPRAIANDGTILADGGVGNVISKAFRWRDDIGLQQVGDPTSPASFVRGINNNGVIAGFMYSPVSTGYEQGVLRWSQADGTEYLGGKLKNYGKFNAFGNAINDSGVIVGSEVMSSSTDGRAFRWSQAKGFQTIDLPGSSAVAINNLGSIVGTYEVTGGLAHAYLLRGDGAFDGSFFSIDGSPNSVEFGDTKGVRLRIQNVSGEPITNIAVTGARVEPVGTDGGKGTLTTTVELDKLSLSNGELAFADFDLKGVEGGAIRLIADVTGKRDGSTVTSQIFQDFSVQKEELKVEVSLDPATVKAEDRVPGTPSPVGVTVTVSNPSDHDFTNVNLKDLKVDRVFAGQPLLYDFGVPGPLGSGEIAVLERPDATGGQSLPDIAAGDSVTLKAKLLLRTAGAFEVSAMVWAKGDTPTTVVAVGKAALTVESGLAVSLDGANGPTADVVDVVATIKNVSGETISGIDWHGGLGMDVLKGSETLKLQSGPSTKLPSSLRDGEQVKVRWRFGVWDVGIAVSTLKATGELASGEAVETVSELSSTVTANDLTAADMQRTAVSALSSGFDQFTAYAAELEAQMSPPSSAGDRMRQASYDSYRKQGFSDMQSKMLAGVSVNNAARERYLVEFADSQNRRAVELGDKFITTTKGLYGVVADPERRAAAASAMVDALKTNGGYLGDAFAIPTGDNAKYVWKFWSDAAVSGSKSIKYAAQGQAELSRLDDALYRSDPLAWGTSAGKRHGAQMADFEATFSSEFIMAMTGEAGSAALKPVMNQIGKGWKAMRTVEAAEAGAGGAGVANSTLSATTAGADDALDAATRQWAKNEAIVHRVQDVEYGTVLTPAELERMGGITVEDAAKINGIIESVEARFGVVIDIGARPAEPLSNLVANGLGKNSYTKEKAIGELDMLLGGPNVLGGRVSVFDAQPLTAKKFAALEAQQPGFSVEYEKRLQAQLKNWKTYKDGSSKTARLIKASEQYNGITVMPDLPGRPTRGVDYLEQLSEPDFLAGKGWTQEYASTVRTELASQPGVKRVKLEAREVEGAYTFVDTIDGTARPIVSDYDIQFVRPKGGNWPAGKRGQIETYIKAELDKMDRSGRHGWSAAANDLPAANFDLAAEFIMNTAHPSVARETATDLSRRFGVLAKEFRTKAARLSADDPMRESLLAKATSYDELTVDKILKKWPSGDKTIVFSKGRITVGSGEGTNP